MLLTDKTKTMFALLRTSMFYLHIFHEISGVPSLWKPPPRLSAALLAHLIIRLG